MRAGAADGGSRRRSCFNILKRLAKKLKRPIDTPTKESFSLIIPRSSAVSIFVRGVYCRGYTLLIIPASSLLAQAWQPTDRVTMRFEMMRFENAVTKVAGGLGQAQFSNSTNGTIKLTSPIQNNKTIVACIVSVNKID